MVMASKQFLLKKFKVSKHKDIFQNVLNKDNVNSPSKFLYPRNDLPLKTDTLVHATTENISVGKNQISNIAEDDKQGIKKKPEVIKHRRNEVGIEMLPQNLYKSLFGKDTGPEVSDKLTARASKHLRDHELLNKIADSLPEVDLNLPKLQGENIEDHFYNIAESQSAPYRNLVSSLLTTIPDLPTSWSQQAGWTKYEAGKKPCSVPYPSEDALVFDIEECVRLGLGPTLATAVSPSAWYSWVSKPLAAILSGEKENNVSTKKTRFTPLDFINLESEPNEPLKKLKHPLRPKVIIGHNVSFDRQRIKEQYWLESSRTRFVDTLSLHVAVSGVTSFQKVQLSSNKFKDQKREISIDNNEYWSNKSSLNNLNEVHKLYCGGEDLKKTARNIFVMGSLTDVAEQFNELVTYCANDVKATHEVLVKIFPMFLERFPHPATFAGMLELSVAYLPVNQSWLTYIREATDTHDDLEAMAKLLLAKKANEACRLLHNDDYKNDPWLWDQDWSTQELTLKKTPTKQSGHKATNFDDWDEEDQDDPMAEKFRYLAKQKPYLPLKKLHLPGYPAWYRQLCPRFKLDDESVDTWTAGPTLITSNMNITPKLLRLTWDGYPLHKTPNHGWGLLIPGRPKVEGKEIADGPPLESILKMCPHPPPQQSEADISVNKLGDTVEKNISKRDYYSAKRKESATEPTWYAGTSIWCPDVNIPGFWFRKLPHPEGVHKNVGNPLSRDFVTRLSEGTLRGEGAASSVLDIKNSVSYWRNNRERVESQQVVWFDNDTLPLRVRQTIHKNGLDSIELGAILPQLQVCGTLTRRAVEKTWLTASNAQSTRVGSELRSMIRAPPGYHMVGADVDSQELWLAALLGDASFAGIHGATAFGWRTLQGRKSDGTDLHSATARAAGTSRDHAKVMNYARIYGAGTNFAQQLLKRFCPSMTEEETRKAAMNSMTLTKGKKMYHLPESAVKELLKLDLCKPSSHDAKQTKAFTSPWGNFGALGAEGELYLNRRELSSLLQQEQACGIDPENAPSSQAKLIWYGGTESAMFNRLEEIANSEQPCTPFLQARLSRALEPQAVGVDNYLTTRVNWVVQSSAVDFLHLMLVNMRWLLGVHSDWRFVLSFHDEVRYMVPSYRKYDAALALHITNLLARAFCARRVGIHDLPRSVAFFSAVEVDLAMRKDANSECTTPSNLHGLSKGYGIPPGETLDIIAAIEKAKSPNLLQKKKYTPIV